ncbi:MAG: PAS domain-containing protein, partial [Alphaproteobacteria bacterium]|nr:PAS domain-containing protein [Alphaproteobacteria bacterium]
MAQAFEDRIGQDTPASLPGPVLSEPSSPLRRRGLYATGALAASLLAALWGAVFYHLDRDKAAVLEAARARTANLTRAYAEHIDGTLRLFDLMLLRIKSEYETNASGSSIFRSLRDAVSLNAGGALSGLTDERGYLQATSRSALPTGEYAGDREYFTALAATDSGRLFIGKPITGRITGQHVIALSRRLNKPDGAFAGVTFVAFAPHYLSGFFDGLAITKDSDFIVLGDDMIVRDAIRGSGPATELIGEAMPEAELAAAANAEGRSYVSGVGDRDTGRLHAYRKLPDYPLTVAASVPLSDVFADYDNRRFRIVLTAALLSFLVLGGAAWHLRRSAERANADQVLRETRAQLRAILDNAPFAVSLKDRQHRYLVLNKQYEKWFRVTQEQQLGRTLSDLGTEPGFASLMEAIEDRVVATGAVEAGEFKEPDIGTAPKWVLTTKFPVIGPDGGAVGIGTFNIDISERKAAEEARHESEARYRLLADHATDIILLTE